MTRLFIIYILFIFNLSISTLGLTQPVPSSEENIPFLVTFGADSDKAWGDDDFSQTFFFKIPESWKKPIFIRVFDPDISGKHDEINGVPDTKTEFSIFGGIGAISDPDATTTSPQGNYKSGTLLESKIFNHNGKYDDKWYTFGPFNPSEGELQTEYGGYIFKVIAEGLQGNDGNLYKYYLSASDTENVPVEGGNAFTFEYCFRLWDEADKTISIYPYINDQVVSVKIHTFDFDNDGKIYLESNVRPKSIVEVSGDNVWSTSTHTIKEKEKNSSLNISIKKDKTSLNNNVVFYITNQYGELLPFYASPIGGIPNFKGTINHKPFTGEK